MKKPFLYLKTLLCAFVALWFFAIGHLVDVVSKVTL